MTDAGTPSRVDYASALAEAVAFLAAPRGTNAASRADDGLSAPLMASDLRYPMPALDPARR